MLARTAMAENGASVQTRLAKGLAPVEGDRVQLQQVILNLILNATEAMSAVDDGARELSISTEQSSTNGVVVEVRDSGPGIDQDLIERIFEAFYTTKSNGVGMGLSICRSIIEAHGGRLWADANERRGAVFHFTLHQSGYKSIGVTRRGFLAGGVSFAAVEYFRAKALANTDRVAARTIAIWHGCAEAAKTGAAYDPGPGDFTVYPLHLPEGVRLVGKRGKTVLRSADGRPIVLASKLRSLLIEGISFYGSAKSANSSLGLIHFEDVETFQLHGAEIADHDGVGVANLRSGGEVLGCTIHDIGDAGYHSTDGLGVAFGRDGDGNRIQGCGNAGVRIWTSQPWIS